MSARLRGGTESWAEQRAAALGAGSDVWLLPELCLCHLHLLMVSVLMELGGFGECCPAPPTGNSKQESGVNIPFLQLPAIR